MSVSVKRKIETTEPVQLTIDFLEEMLAMSSDEEIAEDYWDELLKQKRREIMEDYYALAPLLSSMHYGLFYSEGMASGRLLVMRILLGILPPSNPLGFSLVGIKENIRGTFRDVTQYLKSLYMANEGDHPLWKNSVLVATKILLKKGFSPYFLRRGGWPILAAAPPYREMTAACYLSGPHAVILYSNREISPERRCYYFLHEIGHLIYDKYFERRQVPGFFSNLMIQLQPAELGDFLCPGSQGDKEIFANLFAFTLLMDTQPGDYLFSDYYNKTGDTSQLLKKFFSPETLFKHR